MGQVEIRANDRGHFYVDVFVGSSNVPHRFLVDTGASGVVIPRSVANAEGEWRDCTWRKYATSNGVAESCDFRVSSLRVAGLNFRDLMVSVREDDRTTGLLGMEVLKHFKIEIHNGTLRLSR